MLAGFGRIAEPLTVAGLNATVLSIFFAGVLAYIAGGWAKLDDLTGKAIDKAEEINLIRPPRLLGGPNGEPDKASGPARRHWLRNQFADLVRGGGSDLAARGDQALRALSTLTLDYPFPQGVERKGDGSIEYGQPKRIVFHTTEEIRSWIVVVREVSNLVLWVATTQRSALDRIIAAYSATLENRFEEVKDRIEQAAQRVAAMSPTAAESVGASAEDIPEADASGMALGLVNAFLTADRIAAEAESELHKIDAFWRRRPRRSIVLAFVGFATGAFISGVIVPLVAPGASAIFVVWIPIGFYVALIAAIIVFVYRQYRPPAKPE